MTPLPYQNRAAARAESHPWPPAWVGVNRRAALGLLADVVGGRLLPDPHGGPGRVAVAAGPWALELDFADGPPSTRARARYASTDGFDFAFHPIDGWSWLTGRLGGGRVPLGDPWFDRTFVLRTSGFRRAEGVVGDAAVLTLLRQQWLARAAVRRTHPLVGPPAAGLVNVLTVAVPDWLTDPRRPPLLVSLTVALLERLAAVGSAAAGPV